MPANACDCHCHVFGPFDRFPLADERTYHPPQATVADYLATLERLGMSRGVLVQASAHGMDNRAMLAALNAAPDMLRGVAVVDPSADHQTLQSLYDQGVRGLRFARLLDASGNPRYKNSVDIDALPRLIDPMRRIGLHAQLWLGVAQLAEVAPMIRSAGIPFVIDHLGRPDPSQGVTGAAFTLMCELAAQGHLYVKLTPYRPSLAGAPYDDMRPFHEHLLKACPDRLVWGSDWPHINMPEGAPDAGRLLDLLHEWTGDPGLMTKILATNPARLYGF